MISEAKYKTIHGEEIKNIKIKKNPEQMPERLPAGLYKQQQALHPNIY